jgi:hypothetical protein
MIGTEVSLKPGLAHSGRSQEYHGRGEREVPRPQPPSREKIMAALI